MEIDANKIVPNPTQPAGKVEFLGGVDKAGATYLKTALAAIIEQATDGDKLGSPDDSVATKIKKKLTGNGNGEAKKLLQTPFAELPKEIRDAFFHGTKRRLTFRQGSYKYESDWKGALRVMRDRMENPPSEKTRAALEELVAPVACPVCDGQRLQPESLAVKIAGFGIGEYTELPISEAVTKFDAIKLSPREEKFAGLVLK
jgi:excinuclease ABC subunit A